jgi:Holliday junction DNA helicase RuvA
VIASLRGRIGGRTGGSVVIDVGGVGYLVRASAPTLATLGEPGDEAFLLVHTQVREEAITLFGFRDADERDVFLMLLGVQGVGAAIGLAILSTLEPARVLAVIAAGDRHSLCAAQGVGPKLAARIATELRDKAAQAVPGTAHGAVEIRGGAGDGAVGDVRAALLKLGFQRIEVEQLLSSALSGPKPPADTAAILSACLRAAHSRAA